MEVERMASWLLGTVGIAVLSVVRAPYGTRVKLFSSSGPSFAHPLPFHSSPFSSLFPRAFCRISLISASQAPLLGIRLPTGLRKK